MYVPESRKTRNFLQAATMKEFCFACKASKDMNVERLGRSISCESCVSGVCLGGKSNGYLKMMGDWKYACLVMTYCHETLMIRLLNEFETLVAVEIQKGSIMEFTRGHEVTYG